MLKKCDNFPVGYVSNKIIKENGKIYKFNSLKFRGEEYNPNAKKKIFIGGCSNTFGKGLNLRETWPYQFKKQFKISDKVNILNFAIEGRSNDYITRILMTQSSIVKPDLIIAYFTGASRTEYISENAVKAIGIWHIKKENKTQSEASSFYSYYTDELGFINMLKNILLLQYFCKQNNFDYIFTCYDIKKFSDKKYTSNPICNQFLELIDKKYLCDFRHEYIDYAADQITDKNGIINGGHPGPKSNKLFAEKLFKFYEERIAKKSY